MKLIIVTALAEYHSSVLDVFKKAEIENFSATQIDGYKTNFPLISTSNWFADAKVANESNFYFSFTSSSKIENLVLLIKDNNTQHALNPIRAFVLHVENYV